MLREKKGRPMQITEICYSAPKNGIGYVTETFCDTSTQSAMNLIKARIPAAQISWVRFETVPTPSPSDRRDGGGHR
jgi:hypothetical protein